MAGEAGGTTSPTLNDLQYLAANTAADITTATTSDLFFFADVDDDYEIKVGDGANVLEAAGVTSTAAELNILDGVTSTAAELNILDGVTATAAEINMAADSSANVEVVTTTNLITAAESGKTFFLNHATGFVSTLPAPAAGLRFKFVVSTQNTSGNSTIVTTSGDDVIEGMADVNSTLVLAENEDSINIVASTAIVGDWVEVISDGTSWFVTGQSGAGGGITFTA